MFDHHRPIAPRLNRGLALILALTTATLRAGPIAIANASFESPPTFFVTLNIDGWQRTPQPAWWNTNTSGEWETLVGIFKNTPAGNIDHIDNCHGNQALWLFAQPEAGLFQDYDSVDWNDPTPTHAFDAWFEVGKSYQLTIGLLVGGMANGGGVAPAASVEFSLYYRDGASNRIAVATTSITNSPTVFSNSTHFLDFSVNVPVVRANDPWANQRMGILILSTVPAESVGGYWDLDHVRLTSTLAPKLIAPVRTNSQFHFSVQSEPGMKVEILAAPNPSLPLANWTSLGTVTNTTGLIPFVDSAANFDQRFYQARQVP